MKRAIGIILLLGIFAILFAMTCAANGIKEALVAWGFSLIVTAIIVLAVWLIA